MRIRAGYEIAYDCPAPTPMLLMLNVRPERRPDLETPDTIYSQPNVDVTHYRDLFGNTCSRIIAPAGRLTLSADFVIRDSGLPDPLAVGAEQHPVESLPHEAMTFLLPSRYCEMEHLNDLAWKLFGQVEPGWSRVQAILDYAHARIRFGY